MTEADNFRERIKRASQPQRSPAAVALNEARRAAIEEQRLRDEAHIGVSPGEVWGEEAERLSREFLAYAGEQGFRGTVNLRDRHTRSDHAPQDGEQPVWETTGYGVGAVDLPEIARIPNFAHEVFLCTGDGLLRIFGARRENIFVRSVWSLPQGIVPAIGSFVTRDLSSTVFEEGALESLLIDHAMGKQSHFIAQPTQQVHVPSGWTNPHAPD